MPSITTTIPHNYLPPTWPSLYWPIRATPGTPTYLYYTSDIWRFTLYWTLLFYGAVHIFASGWAVLMQLRCALARSSSQKTPTATSPTPSSRPSSGHQQPKPHTRTRTLQGTSIKQTLTWVWAVPLVYCVVGGIEAVMAGSVVGLILGAVYSAGYYKMSTWMPLLWGLINVLVLILASFSIQGGL